MESMTGYSFLEGKTGQFTFSVELKALNTKYIEVFINIPKVIRTEENTYLDLVKKFISRGKVELNIEIFDWIESRNIDINNALFDKYYNEILKIEKKIKDRKISLDAILQMEGVICRGRTQITDESKNEILKVLNRAIKNTLKMRAVEGKSVEKDMTGSLKEINAAVREITVLSKDAVKNNFSRLKDKIEKISSVEADPNRLYTEIAILTDKLDINEELSRLNDHNKKFVETMKENGAIGKKLDFIAQEMFREINTIASKSNNSAISQHAVTVKNNIDKIREQSRNIV
ncbi:MAG: YicC family protein [Spirochaetes bacterium]|nr:YicC family protein [Spirochaetota bacterium]